MPLSFARNGFISALSHLCAVVACVSNLGMEPIDYTEQLSGATLKDLREAYDALHEKSIFPQSTDSSNPSAVIIGRK